MKDLCILSDFDGTITPTDSLFYFFKKYADKKWLEVEQDWTNGKISSKECLVREFNLVKNLSEKLISEYLANITIDETFVVFYNKIKEKNIDFFIVSDGVDYFINKILEKAGLKNLNIISNHGEFKNGNFVLSFPYDCKKCKNNAGTCKCSIVEQKRKQYKKIIYFGDGTSDFCVADKVDKLFAKTKLLNFCSKQKINATPFEFFKDIPLIF